MRPIMIWLVGITALVALLAVQWDFPRPLAFVAVGATVIGLLVSFFISRRSRANGAHTEVNTKDRGRPRP